jgi:hypothetical protein
MKTLAALLLIGSLAAPAFAVKTQYFKHTTPADFAGGTLTGLVASAQGDLRLGRKVDLLLPAGTLVGAVQAMAELPDGVVFATFPGNDVMTLRGGKVETLANFGDRVLTALAVDAKGRIYAAIAGDGGKVYRLGKPGEAPTLTFEGQGIDYVWQILPRDDKLIVATGPKPTIFEIGPDNVGVHVATLPAGEHVLSLVAGDDSTYYAGTGGLGLVYRVSRASGKSFLLYDAAESDITALAIDQEGRLLVGTGAEAGGEPAAQEAAVPAAAPASPAAPATLPADARDVPRPPEDAPRHPPIPTDDVADVDAPATGPAVATPALPTPPSPAGVDVTPGEGNALYRIDGDGFATELYRGPVVIYGLAVQDKTILIATGNDGTLYQLRPESTTPETLVKTDAAQVSAVHVARDGRLLLGLSNSGQIAQLSPDHAGEGRYVSPVLDAGQASRFGQAQLRGQLPEGTSIAFATRSGNAADPDQGGWSDWSTDAPAKAFVPVASPAARYVQYRLTLTSTVKGVTPIVDDVSIAYQKPNFPPRLGPILITPAEDAAAPGGQTVSWEATDPNEDALRYTLEARLIDKGGWTTLAKDLTTPSFAWPAGSAADGRYELRVTASDAVDNAKAEAKSAQRVSDPFANDRTPPQAGDFETSVNGDTATIKFRVVDRLGTVASVAYSVEKADDWQKVLPDDTIADSPEERYTIALTGLAKGEFTLTVRATDEAGNASFEVIGVKVP